MIIRCLDVVRRVTRPVRHAWRHRAVRHTAALGLVIWVPCAIAAGLAFRFVPPAAVQADYPIAVPAPSMLLVWVAAGVFIAARRK
jgi:hypothetical protein